MSVTPPTHATPTLLAPTTPTVASLALATTVTRETDMSAPVSPRQHTFSVMLIFPSDIAGERAANIIARAAEFADTAAADLVNDTRALNRVNKALGQYEALIEYVRTWEAGCMNNVDLQDSVEASDLSSDEELLGWEISDLCSFANDMQVNKLH